MPRRDGSSIVRIAVPEKLIAPDTSSRTGKYKFVVPPDVDAERLPHARSADSSTISIKALENVISPETLTYEGNESLVVVASTSAT